MIGVGTLKISPLAKRYVNQVLDSDRLSYGPFTQRFERSFAAAHDCRYATMTNSGTSCLQIALAALKSKYHWKDGDEVIVPAITFVATANIVVQNNMKPVFVDVDPHFYELNVLSLEAKITSSTRCIIPVHLFGLPCDMDPIMTIARRHDLRVIEDSCETMFTRYRGKSVGSFGDIGCFSTYVAHLLTTGVGGLCTTNDADLAVRLRSLMNHGRDAIYTSIDDDKDKSKEELEMIIQRRFSFVQLGYSYRVTELEGALGLAQFEEREEMLSKRRANGAFLTSHLSKHDDRIQLPSLRPDSGHAFMMYPIVVRDESKDAIVNFLEQNGIETREMMPLVTQPYYRDVLGTIEDDFPVAKWINNNGFYIASHQDLTEAEKRYIVETFDSYFSGREKLNDKTALIVFSKGTGKAAEIVYESLAASDFNERVLIEASDDMFVPQYFQKRGFKVIQEPRGKGFLLMQAVAGIEAENVVLIGLDGSDDARDIDKILIELKKNAELVIASRFMPGGGRESDRRFSYRSLGNRLFTFLINVILRRNITDANNLFRGFKRSSFLKLQLREKSESIMFEMTVCSLKAGFRFAEVPTTEKVGYIRHGKRNRLLSAASFSWILLRHALGAAKVVKVAGA